MQQTNDQLNALRREIADFLNTEVTDFIRETGKKTISAIPPFEGSMEFQKLLHQRKGWAGVNWPKEYGGTGWNTAEQNIFHEECRKRDLPFLLPNALNMVGPAIMKYGSNIQKERYLPEILSGEAYWAQGYSEPNAGSDLVSMKCRAEREGDEYVINGSKIWTTYAHLSKRMFLLVKTDLSRKPQRGISFLLLDSLEYPGMTVKPIIGLDGFHEQCEVFFDNVRVPVSSCLGEENDGWSVAKYLLDHERGGAMGFSIMLTNQLERIKRIASHVEDGYGNSIINNAAFQQRFASLYVEAKAFGSLEKRLSAIDMNSPQASYFSSIQKVVWTECLQRICALAVDVCGSQCMPLQLEALVIGSDVRSLGMEEMLTVMPSYLNNHAASIYGGTNEIQREIIAKAIFATI